MGRVFKPIVYKLLPDGAELLTRKGQRFGQRRIACRVDGGPSEYGNRVIQ